LVLKGDAAERHLRKAETEELDKFHRRFALWRRPRASARLQLLRAHQVRRVAVLRAQRRAPWRAASQLLENRLGLGYALEWAFGPCAAGGCPHAATDRAVLPEAAEVLEHATAYSLLSDAHRAFGRGLFALEYDTERKSFRFGITPRWSLNAVWARALEREEADAAKLAAPRAAPRELVAAIRRFAGVTGPDEVTIDWAVATSKEARSYGEWYMQAMAWELPGEWDLDGYTLADFRRLWQTVWVIAQIHAAAHLPAASLGVTRHVRMETWVPVRTSDAWRRFVTDVSGLDVSVVSAIIDDLTYTPRAVNTGPVLRPFIPVDGADVALCLDCVQNSNPEHNLLRAINRAPSRKAAYDQLSSRKEELFLREVTPELQTLRIKHAKPRREIRGLTDIDLLLWQEKTGTLLVVELKWLLPGGDINDVDENDQAFEKAARDQVLPAVQYLRDHVAEVLPRWIPGADASKVRRIEGLIVNKTEAGTGGPAAQSVPVVDWPRFWRHLCKDGPRDLHQVYRWCANRPDRKQRAREFVAGETEVKVGGYTYLLPAFARREAAAPRRARRG